MARNNPENVGDGILRMRDELKKILTEEETAARHARRAGIAALKTRHAAIRAGSIVSDLPQRQGFLDKLRQKNLDYKKRRTGKLEAESRDADETLKRLTESRRALTARLAQAMGVEPPLNVSEQDVEEYLEKEKLHLQVASKELEEAEETLRGAALEKEKKEQKPPKPEEPAEKKPAITDGGRERLKKAEETLKEAALEREKKEPQPPKPEEPAEKKTDITNEERERLKKAEAALKEAALEKEKKEQPPPKPEEPVEIKAKPAITDEEREHLRKAESEYLNAVEKEKNIQHAVQKRKELIGEREKEMATQPVSKELEEAEAVLKEAALNRARIGQELNDLKKSIDTSVRTELTDEEKERLKIAKAEHHNAVEREKSIEAEIEKKKKSVGSQSEKYRPLFQFMLKELEEAEAALKEAALERERREHELNNLVDKLVEAIETRVKANITDEKLERLKKTEAEYLKAMENEKSIGSEIIKKKELAEKNQEKYKTVIRSLLRELGDTEAALKEAAMERGRKEREFRNLKKALDIKVKPEFTEKEI